MTLSDAINAIRKSRLYWARETLTMEDRVSRLFGPAPNSRREALARKLAIYESRRDLDVIYIDELYELRDLRKRGLL